MPATYAVRPPYEDSMHRSRLVARKHYLSGIKDYFQMHLFTSCITSSLSWTVLAPGAHLSLLECIVAEGVYDIHCRKPAEVSLAYSRLYNFFLPKHLRALFQYALQTFCCRGSRTISLSSLH